MIRIGCCGWSYRDWIGPFYPPELRDRKGAWLEHYGQYFPTVEIDSTFYSVPGDRTVEAWLRKGKALEGFDFSLKMHRDVTHNRILSDVEGAVKAAVEFEKAVVAPLREEGLLGAVLLQLAPRFKRHDGERDNLLTLRTLLEALNVDDHDYVVEFRHKSWLQGEQFDPEVMEFFRERNVGVCSVDEPFFPRVSAITADHSYLRFHGRNYDIWWKDEKEIPDQRINRYDYLYTEEELKRWVPAVEEMAASTDKSRVYFNNHGRAKAAKNAFQLMDMLGIPHREKDISIKEQFTLESF
jgi:uncharacterized protein YecE (DUF72 family)